MNRSLFIARRFLQAITHEKTIAAMLSICGVSIVVSSCALALIMAIMNGFHYATTRSLQGIHSDVTMQAPAGRAINFKKINATLHKEFPHLVAHATPLAYHHAILQTKAVQDISHVVVVQGIDPVHDNQTRSLMQMLNKNNTTTPFTIPEQSLAISTTLAEELGIQTNDNVTLLFSDDNGINGDLSFEKSTIKVSTLFKSGIDEFDRGVVFCTLTTFKKLFPDTGVAQIGIKLQPGIDAAHAISELKQRFKLELFSWQELYPALLDALTLERWAMFLILILVACITSITTIALLMMYIFHQKTTFALFTAMGMRMLQLRVIVTLIGVSITLISTLFGILLATGMSFLLEHYKLITLPDIYYINHVPAHMDIMTVILVICLMNGVGLITSWLTTGLIQNMNLAKLLK